MTPRGEEEAQVRRFLLGQLNKLEQQRVEETLMIDTDYREQVLLVEETLIEDYLEGLLSAEEKEAFETYFAASTQQRRKIKIARLLSNYDSPNLPDDDQPAALRPSLWQRLPINLIARKHPVVFTCVVMLLLVGFGVFQGVRLWRESRQQLEARQQKLQIERELTQLSGTPVQDLKVSTFALTLAPMALRAADDSSTLPLPFTTEIIELRLLLSGNIYPRYIAELSRIAGTETYRIEGLNAQPTVSGQAVVIRIPSRLLSRGDYKLALAGIAGNGNKTDAGEYFFHVGSQ